MHTAERRIYYSFGNCTHNRIFIPVRSTLRRSLIFSARINLCEWVLCRLNFTKLNGIPFLLNCWNDTDAAFQKDADDYDDDEDDDSKPRALYVEHQMSVQPLSHLSSFEIISATYSIRICF